MLKYTLRKLGALIPKMLVISLILFLGLEALPGDPITRSIPVEVLEEMTEAQIEILRENAGLNDPVMIRYFRWIGDLLTGDFGYSQVTGQNISEVLATRMPYTMELCIYGLTFATIFGIVLGFISAVMKRTPIDYAINTFSVLGVSVPEFFVAICLVMVFALKLGWLPTGGRMDPDGGSRIPYMILPIASMAIQYSSTLVRYVRNTMLEVMDKEYIKTARSKGMREVIVYLKHAFRNAMIPVMITIVMRLPMLIGGFVVIEQVFNYAGVGVVQLEAINQGDLPVAMIILMLSGMLTMVASTLADLFTALLDPRVRLE